MIRTATSTPATQFMQVYWSAYDSLNMTDKDDHEAACCKAIAFCMYNGATQSEVLKLVDSRAPIAVWEKDGQYAIRTMGELNRERETAKESSFAIADSKSLGISISMSGFWLSIFLYRRNAAYFSRNIT